MTDKRKGYSDILFKAKQTRCVSDDEKIHEWVFGAGIIMFEDKAYIVCPCERGMVCSQVDIGTVCQCTGIKDSNNVYMYEDDEVYDYDVGVVVWNDKQARFEICFENSEYPGRTFNEQLDEDMGSGLKIVGNLHEEK